MLQATYEQSVFINCPFDAAYQPILHAIIYTVFRCGFEPRTAMDEDDGSESRLNKIIRIIRECNYGIHDLSRIELNDHDFPRFNMPFELGLFFGAKEFGRDVQKNKNALVFERDKFKYQQFISDLNGIDPKAHENNPHIAIKKVRDWLLTNSPASLIPSSKSIISEYTDFLGKLKEIVSSVHLNADGLHMVDYRNMVRAFINDILTLPE
ncbi:MAG: hypothetical protein ACTHLE_08240 [Agriterribacter sp.]